MYPDTVKEKEKLIDAWFNYNYITYDYYIVFFI